MSPWLFNEDVDGVVREANAWVVGKCLALVRANGDRFEINQLDFTDDTHLVADSEEMACRLVSEKGRVCKGAWRVNVSES